MNVARSAPNWRSPPRQPASASSKCSRSRPRAWFESKPGREAGAVVPEGAGVQISNESFLPGSMSDPRLDQLDEVQASRGDAAAISQLIETLQAGKDFHRLFDALLLQKRFEMGLPLVRPTSLDDVPEDRQQEFEDHYVAAARRIGEAFLADNN